MTIRLKLLLGTVALLLGLLLVMSVASWLVLGYSFRQAEEKLARESMQSLERVLDFELSRLDSIAAEWAPRDETGRYMMDPSDRVLPDKLDAATLRNLGVHLFLLADLTGGVVISRFVDPLTGEPGPASDALRGYLAPTGPLLRLPDPKTSRTNGLVLSPKGPMLVAARPVSDSVWQPPVRGVLVVGRLLEDKLVISHLSAALPGRPDPGRLQVTPLAESPVALSPRRAAEDAAAAIAVLPLGKDMFQATKTLEDVQGYPAVQVSARIPRALSRLSGSVVVGLTLLIGLIALLFALLLLFLQERTAVEPLARLSVMIRSLSRQGDPGQRLRWIRRDELGVVATEVDHLLGVIEENQAAARESGERMRALVTANPDTIFVLDRHGRFLELKPDPSFAGALARQDLVGRPLRDAGLPEDLAGLVADALTRVLETGEVQTFEHPLTAPAGPLWGEFRMVRLGGDRALTIVRDISARKRAEDERARMQEQMLQAQKFGSLGVFAGGIAHDFNNLLTAIIGYAELAESSLPPTAPLRGPVDNIKNSALKAASLTQQILTYAGRREYDAKVFDLNSLLEELFHFVQASVSKKLTLECRLEPGLPPIFGDPSQIWQVGLNLLTNASEALGDRAGTVRIGTRAAQPTPEELREYLGEPEPSPNGHILLEVTDSGPGMDADTLGRIFDPFFTTKAPGRGLGLSAVLGTVHTHHGGIRVISRPGAGTTVRILLPVAAAPAAARPTAPTASIPAPDGPRRILVAEDEAVNRSLAATLISMAGHEVVTAADGREAVGLFATRPQEIDLVLLDVEMPEMDGAEACRAIREIRADIPVVIMSGYGIKAMEERFRALRPDGYLAKPFLRDDFLATIGAALSSRRR